MSTLPTSNAVKYVAYEILPHIHSFSDMEPYTNHGIRHSENVLTFLEKMQEICGKNGFSLNEAEKLILECACWLHDIGCIRDRESHARHSVDIIRTLCEKGLLNLGIIKEQVEYVVYAHSKKGIKLEDVEEIQPITGIADKVRLRYICALFKLADECDITRLRAPRAVYEILKDKLPADSKLWWLGHDNVINIDFLPEEGKILVHMKEEDTKGMDMLKSLKETLEESKDILEKNKFPCIECDVLYHPPVNIEDE